MKSCFALISIALGASVGHASPLGFDNARHLLNRAQFSASVQEIETFAEFDRSEAANRLLRGKVDSAAARPPQWVNEKIVPPRKIKAMSEEERKAVRREMLEKSFELREWWFGEMLATRSPLTEKMTLFWHSHFATSQKKVRYPQLMYRQNALFRRHALGNFATMLREVARDPAMIVFLDSATNRKGQPNENFAREVMELFTLGEGHYSERDVKEAARAFTGWSIEPETGEFRFRRFQHDSGAKTVLGKSGKLNGDEVLDILLAHPRTAEFVTEKLWREFVSPEPDADEVKRLASAFRQSGYDISVLMRELLTSNAFYANENRAALIKSPVELMVGTMKLFDIEFKNPRPVVVATAFLGQNIFSPPNVKGWPGGEAWINSTTLLARKQTLARLFRAEEMPVAETEAANKAERRMKRADQVMGRFGFDYERWARDFENSDEMARVVLAQPPAETISGERIERVRQWVLDPVYQLK